MSNYKVDIRSLDTPPHAESSASPPSSPPSLRTDLTSATSSASSTSGSYLGFQHPRRPPSRSTRRIRFAPLPESDEDLLVSDGPSFDASQSNTKSAAYPVHLPDELRDSTFPDTPAENTQGSKQKSFLSFPFFRRRNPSGSSKSSHPQSVPRSSFSSPEIFSFGTKSLFRSRSVSLSGVPPRMPSPPLEHSYPSKSHNRSAFTCSDPALRSINRDNLGEDVGQLDDSTAIAEWSQRKHRASTMASLPNAVVANHSSSVIPIPHLILKKKHVKMLNGRVYGAKRYAAESLSNPFANLREEPEFVEWGYGGMGSASASIGNATWKGLQRSGALLAGLSSTSDNPTTGAGVGQDKGGHVTTPIAHQKMSDHVPKYNTINVSSGGVAEDDGSGIAWVKKRRAEREAKARAEQEAKELEKKIRQERKSGDSMSDESTYASTASIITSFTTHTSAASTSLTVPTTSSLAPRSPSVTDLNLSSSPSSEFCKLGAAPRDEDKRHVLTAVRLSTDTPNSLGKRQQMLPSSVLTETVSTHSSDDGEEPWPGSAEEDENDVEREAQDTWRKTALGAGVEKISRRLPNFRHLRASQSGLEIPQASQLSDTSMPYTSRLEPSTSIVITHDDTQIVTHEEGATATLSTSPPIPRDDDRSDEQSTRRKVDILLRRLNGLDCTAKHQEFAVLHVPGTCLWLYHTDEYTTWRKGDEPFLWLQGKAGSGKSVLAYSVIEHLKESPDPITFFYCDYQDDKSASAAQVMYSLLCQMLHHFRDSLLKIRVASWSLIDELHEKSVNGSLSDDQQLPLLVARIAQAFPQRPLVIIDALDECNDIERLLDALATWNRLGGMQILVTSRPLQIIKERLLAVSPKSVISWDKFENAVFPDILKFIDRELDAFNRLGAFDTRLKERVTSVLLEKAEGMFLWAKYQVDILARCSNVSEIWEVLDKLSAPVGFYDRIICGNDNQQARVKFVRRALAWLVSALRPIRLRELVEALVVDIDCQTMDPERLQGIVRATVSTDIPSHQTLYLEIGSILLHALGSLVTHNEATDCVAFLHSSIKTYLTDPSTDAQYQIDLQDAHEELAATCMCYFSLCLRGCLASVNDEPPFRVMVGNDVQQAGHLQYTGSPLLEYVLSKSFHHLPFLLPENEAILGDMLALESDLQGHPDEWESVRKMASHTRPLPSVKHDFIIYTLVAFAPDWLLHAFLDRESLFLRLERHHGVNPLIYAASFRAIDQARTLLFRGASLHSCGWLIDDSRQALPLAAAVHVDSQPNEMLELFLEWQSPVPPDLFADLVSKPSSFALPTVKQLLETDAFIEWSEHHQERYYPFHSFISVGPYSDDEDALIAIVWRLIQVGFDPCVPDLGGKTALHLASAKGYLSLVEYLVSVGVQLPSDILFFVLESGYWNVRTARMVRYLLEEGADINSRLPDNDGDTLLHTAIKNAATHSQSPSDSNAQSNDSLFEIVTTLVDFGCDPHSRNVENYTPLHLAIVGGHVPVVEYLSQVTIPLPEDLSTAISLAPSLVQDDIREFLRP